MAEDVKVTLIGLDTSHTIEFARRMVAPDCPAEQKVEGIKPISCMRFKTPFQSEEGLDERQKQLEKWGVKVTADFDEAVSGCDAIMLEINDPAYHLEYFKKSVPLGKPIFLDKPLADNKKNGEEIYRIVKEKNIRMFSASPLRFVPQLKETCEAMPRPYFGYTYGPLGKAPAGSSIVWYGVHAFEMLQRVMGRGSVSVYSYKDKAGVVSIVEYPDGRRGVVELSEKAYIYGGVLRNFEKAVPFVVDMSRAYSDLLQEIAKFFKGAEPPVEIEDTVEVMNMLDAAERSFQSNRTEKV